MVYRIKANHEIIRQYRCTVLIYFVWLMELKPTMHMKAVLGTWQIGTNCLIVDYIRGSADLTAVCYSTSQRVVFFITKK